uniref:Uncharacterized protein n=1 Tax=Lactuca sativa TaxID=4236 RepID=A0A9R1WHT5_LACSA|nr:hypothetical protein LSAT_V11C100000790 [Lactuca sativa]
MITLTEAILDYIQRNFVERDLMASNISDPILSYLITCTRTLFDHIFFSRRLTTALTSYIEMVLHKRMQKSVQWQATKIPPKISSPFPLGITCDHATAASRYSNIHELPNMVTIYYPNDVFQTAYETQTVHPLPFIRMKNIGSFDGCFIANCLMENIIIAQIFVTYYKDKKNHNL